MSEENVSEIASGEDVLDVFTSEHDETIVITPTKLIVENSDSSAMSILLDDISYMKTEPTSTPEPPFKFGIISSVLVLIAFLVLAFSNGSYPVISETVHMGVVVTLTALLFYCIWKDITYTKEEDNTVFVNIRNKSNQGVGFTIAEETLEEVLQAVNKQIPSETSINTESE